MTLNRFAIDPLECRLLFAVNPHIALLDDVNVITAGQAVHVNAVQTNLPIGADLGVGSPLTARYQWDFGDDTPDAKYNVLPGFNAAHVYDTPGLYTITLTVTNEAGEVGVAVKRIRVNPAPVMPATIYVDNAATGVRPDPSGGVVVPSIASALPLISDNTQLLFKRGQIFSLTQTIHITHDNVTIGAYGEGAAPILRLPAGYGQFYPMISTAGSAQNTSVRELRLEAAGSSRIGVGVQPAGRNFVIRDCTFQNLDDAILASLAPVGLLAMDNTAGVLREYFAYIKGTDHVYLGNTIGDSTGQHNFRTYGERVLCYGNDATNLPGGSSIATLRVNDGAWVYWANNTLRSGQVFVGPLGPESAGSRPGSGVNWVVMENNTLLQVPGHHMSNSRIEIDPGTHHIVLRNNYIEATDTAAINVDTKDTLTWKPNQLPPAPIPLPPVTVNKTAMDVLVLENTVVNPDLKDGTRRGKKGAFIEVSGGTTNAVTLKGNTYVAPMLDTTAYTAAAVRVMSRKDLNNFTGLGIENNIWPHPGNLHSRGVHYVSDGSLSSAAAYRTPAEWSSFTTRVNNDQYQNLQVGDVSVNSAFAAPRLTVSGNDWTLRGLDRLMTREVLG